jgi:hypothetical protein
VSAKRRGKEGVKAETTEGTEKKGAHSFGEIGVNKFQMNRLGEN